jgi:cytochrome c oxidase cbb3-type subunit 1
LGFTNFTVGHSHLTMYGFVTFAIWGGVAALLP